MTEHKVISLSRSIIEQYYPEEKAAVPTVENAKRLGSGKTAALTGESVMQLGGTLQRRSEAIYEKAQQVRGVVASAARNPARFGCSVLALASGVANVCSGNYVMGGISTALGAKEIINQCNGGNSLELQSLLSDINADVDMVHSLEEGQQKSYQVVEENLKLIYGDVTSLYGKLDEIKNLNLESIQSLEGAKKEAFEKGLKAKEAYREALVLFKGAQESFAESKKVYSACANHFTRINQIATDEDGTKSLLQKMDALVQVAKTAKNECNEGKQQLETAEQKFGQAMQAFVKASKLKDEAFEKIAKTVQSAEDALKAGLEKAKYAAECQARVQATVQATQKEVQEIKDRGNDILKLLDEMTEDVKTAKEAAAKKLDFSDVLLGAGATAVLAPLGTAAAVGAGVTAAYAWHNGTAIADTVKKMCSYVSGKPNTVQVPKMNDSEIIRTEFQAKSSGFYGAWIKGRQSYTVGSVNINLGGSEVMSLGFNLNDEKYPVAKEDLVSLYRKLVSKLEDGTLSTQRCRGILNSLQTTTISRGGLHTPVTGLIKKNQAADGLMKWIFQLCDKMGGP